MSDAVLNVLLFMPLGAALAALGLVKARTVLLCALLSGTIELVQFASTRGRAADPMDLLSNTLGALLGACAWLVVLDWSRGRSTTTAALGVASAWWVACAAAAWGLQPYAPINAEYIAQWARPMPGWAAFRGRIDTVSVGGLYIADGPVGRSTAIASAVAGAGVRFHVAGEGLVQSLPIGPVAGVTYNSGRLASVSMAECRLQGRVGTNSERIGLGAPRVHIADACGQPDAPFRIDLRQDGKEMSLELTNPAQRRAAFVLRPNAVWVLLAPTIGSGGRRDLITLLFTITFGLLVGALAARAEQAIVARTVAFAALMFLGVVLPAWVFKAGAISVLEAAALVLATLAGGALARSYPRGTPGSVAATTSARTGSVP